MKLRNLLCAFALALLPLAAGAQTATTSDGVTWTYTTDGMITNVALPAGFSGILVFPATLNGITITGIGDGAEPVFASQVTLSGMDFSQLNNNTSINGFAFGLNTSADPISDPNVRYVTLETPLVVPSNITSIGPRAFRGITAQSLDLSGATNLTSIDDATFGYALFTTTATVVIPEKVVSIGANAFFAVSGIADINLNNAVNLATIDNQAFNWAVQHQSISPNGVIGGDLIIPDNVNTIGVLTFNHCVRLTSVVVGNGVTDIGKQAFYGCEGMASLKIGDGVTNIDPDAFVGCSGLTSVVIDSPNVLPSMFTSAINLITMDMSADTNTSGESITTVSRTDPASPFCGLPITAMITLPLNTDMALKGTEGDVGNYIWPDGTVTGIANVVVGNEKNAAIYTIDGRYVGTDMDSLAKGVYIIGGKKVVR